MIFRQLFDAESSTYTYLVADPVTHRAALIDPVRGQEERDLLLVRELGLTLAYALDTHVHADHVTALGSLARATGCKTGVCHRAGTTAALQLRDGDELRLGDATALRVLETPGHTDTCLSYFAGDRVFTGDALLVRGCGRTDFQSGDAGRLYDSVVGKLFPLADEVLVYPGHDYKGRTVTTIGEERRYNARLVKPRHEFVELMRGLSLPPPKRLAEAVPANLRLGDA